jgi:GrpB-like predicted nucleotidyltransferase (UPF0157 family)
MEGDALSNRAGGAVGICVYLCSPVAATSLELVPYDPAWPVEFAAERDRIGQALGSLAVRIDHNGSTSVPGLAAKPVIDILVGLRAYPLAPQCIAALEGLGYVCRGESGMPGRQYFRKGSPETHHVHATLEGGDVWRSHIAFRDWLRAHPNDAARYGELKRRLAAEHRESRALYTEAKAPFVESILRRSSG